MLRRVEVHNFAPFVEKQSIDIDPGSHFLIGENDSGKTSFFECIKWCMSASQCRNLPRAIDSSKLSYIKCTFHNVCKGNLHIITSCLVRIPLIDCDQLFLKLVQTSQDSDETTNTSGRREYADVVKVNKNGEMVCYPLPQNLVTSEVMTAENFPYSIERIVTNNLDEVHQLLHTELIYTYTECEHLLKEKIDHCTAMFYPFRSRSPLASVELAPEQERCCSNDMQLKTWETCVLKWFLESRDSLDEKERQNEKHIFNIITAGSCYEFRLEEGGVVSFYNRQNRKPHLDSPFPTMPEGIHHAKVLAILLAVRKFQTVCVDDAEIGMHPQMIERVRDFILPDICDKTVLLITHSPVFLTRWNMQRSFLFQRATKEKLHGIGITHLKTVFRRDNVLNGSTTDTSDEEEKSLQLLTDRNCTSIFFAKNILFVEGKSDELFMTQFMKILMNRPELLSNFMTREDNQTVDKVQYFLSGLYIIQMNGAPNAYKFSRICQRLGMNHYFILDYDAMNGNIPKGTTGKTTEERMCNALSIDVPSHEISALATDVTILEIHRVFMWRNHKKMNEKSGRIENVLCSLYDRTPNRNDCSHVFVKKRKLLLDKDFTFKDLQGLVIECLEMAAEDSASDIHRLVRFFVKMCEKDNTCVSSS